MAKILKYRASENISINSKLILKNELVYIETDEQKGSHLSLQVFDNEKNFIGVISKLKGKALKEKMTEVPD